MACCTPGATWKKLLWGCMRGVDLDASVKDNLRAIARRLDRDIEISLSLSWTEIVIPVNSDIHIAGARIRLISDGDLSAGITVALRGTGFTR
jgi:fructose-1,6-bisphosphatase/sedoheptulose 1,7-bisphosphatase-like protein